jgi:hypothetical protein
LDHRPGQRFAVGERSDLSFVDPVKLMNLTTDSTTVNGIPIGMTSAVVNYFRAKAFA